MAAPEPSSGSNPTGPNVRYYDTRPSPRRWATTGALVAVLVVLVAAAAWFVTDGFGRGGAEAATSQVGTNGLPVGATGEPGSAETPPADRPAEGLGVAADATSVVVVGDSITQGSADEIRYVMAGLGYTDITVDGLTSRRIVTGGDGDPESGTQAVRRLLDEGADPDVWVIALGTNDIGKYASSEEYGALVSQLVDLLPDDRPLLWVDAYRDDYVGDSEVFDEAVRAQLSDRDGTVVVSWFDVATAEPSLLRDGVHPTSEGRARFAGVIGEGMLQLR
jgi:lysophospholipase L1-like esterase